MAEHTMSRENKTTMRAGWRALVALAAVLAGVMGLLGVGVSSAGAYGYEEGVAAVSEVKAFSIERSTTQAGGHPDLTIEARFTNKNSAFSEKALLEGTIDPCLCADVRRVSFHFPTGLIGNPKAIPSCTLAELGVQVCPPDSQVGLSHAVFPGQQFVYNMEPRPGEPGLIATEIPILGSPIFTILRGRTDSDYGLDGVTPDIYHVLGLSDVILRIWGVPTDPSHNLYRAPIGLQTGCSTEYPEPCYSKPTPATAPSAPYLQNPTTCAGPLTASVDALFYNRQFDSAEWGWAPTTSCDLLAFNPSLTASPTTEQADSPSGMDIEAKVPQIQSPSVPSASEVRAVRVTLPEGFSVNPNAADGKSSCTDQQSAIGTLDAAQCPEAAKIGTLTVDSSALPGPIGGAVYLGEPKPGERYRLILVASGFETHVKLAGKVSLAPGSGQISVSFENLPQAPLQGFNIHIFGAERGLLATPERCGTYTVDSEFVPWAAELGSFNTSTSFEIDSGPDGGPCPGASRPLRPSLVAGSPDNTAGSYSPFALKLDRKDGDQNLAGLRVRTAPGFAASLRGISYCPQAAIDQLADYYTHSGLGEIANPSCPAASQVGVVTAAAGAGSRPLDVSGKVYLAGPYKGAPISVLVVIPAVSGPYDVGTVAVRAGIEVDPTTAQVTTVSDPLPQAIEGIPLRVRSILVNLNRPNFALNPTNCDPFSVDASVFGDEGGIANPAAFYQVANCAALPFAPKLSLKLRGSSKRLGHPALRTVFEAAPGEANLRNVTVTMPSTLQLDNAHIGTVCTRVQFAASACPANSMIGSARAETPLLDQPLAGPVYLRSSSNPLPDLVIDLKGQLDVTLVGEVDSARQGGLRATFDQIPDAPVSGFVLDLRGADRGLLINTVGLCKARPKATVSLNGQNGASLRSESKLQVACPSRKTKRGRHRSRSPKRAGAVR